MHLRDYFTANDLGEQVLSGVRIEKLAKTRRHHFSYATVAKYEGRGLLTKTDTTITLHTVDGDMAFNIDHPPGRYCLHCQESLPDEHLEDGGAFIPQGDPRLGAGARAHVEAKHKGKKSPNPAFPHGYKMKNYWGVTPDDSVPTINPKAIGSILAEVALGV